MYPLQKFIIIFLFINSVCIAQSKTDSLLHLINQADEKQKVRLQLELANEYMCENDSLSLLYAQKALEKATTLNLLNEQAQALNNIGSCYSRMSKFKDALVYLKKSLVLYEELNYPKEVTLCFSNLGTVYDGLGDFKESGKNYNEALKYARKNKNKSNESLILFNLGSLLLKQDKYNEALEDFLISMKMEEEMKNPLGVAYCLNELGQIYNILHLYKEEEDSYFKALDIFKTQGLTYEESIIYNNLGDHFLCVGNKQKSLEYYFRSVSLKSKAEQYCGLVLTYARIGDVYFDTGQLDSASMFYNKSIEAAVQCDYTPYKSRTLLGLGKIQLNRKQYRQAIQLFTECYNIVKDETMTETQRDALLLLSQADSAIGNMASSREYLRKASELNNQLNNSNANRRLGEMTFRFETEKKDREIELQKKINGNQKLLLWSVIVILLLVTFFLIFVYIEYQNKKKTNKILAFQKSEIDKKNEQLKELDEIKSRFFANVSHEFRTPLTLIMGPAERLMTRLSDNTDRQDAALITQNAKHLNNLINQLLDIAKIERGSLKLVPMSGNLSDFLLVRLAMFASLALERNIQFTYELPEEYNHPVIFDADKLEKILFNLISNAFKYTPSGKTIKVITSYNSDYSTFKIDVSDTGKGIEASELPYIFDRFYQSNRKPAHDSAGTGIGLALVNEMVKLYNGKIQVESKVDAGSTFRVTLPCTMDAFDNTQCAQTIWEKEIEFAKPNTSDSLTNEKNQTPIPKNKAGKTILIVEDNAEMQNFIASQLMNDYKIILANNGNEGVNMALKSTPDLIISDVMMPEKDGYLLTSELKNNTHTSHIPIILLTAKAAEESKIKGLESDADDYLTKPFSLKELDVRVKNLIRSRERLREQFARNIEINPSEITATSIDERFLQSVLAAIEKNIDNAEYTIEQLSDDVNMSRANMHRKLKALTGISATDFLRTIRLKRAAQLLKQKAGTVSEIAFQVGFGNLSYFTKSFKEQFGALPSEYN